MAEIVAPAGDTAPSGARPERMDRSAWGWALYEAARNPYVIVCGIYVFVPYVATVVIGDPVEGQAQIAALNKWAGIAVACMAPFIGAWADRAGRRKVPLALVSAVMAVLVASLWTVTPDGPALWFALLLGIGLCFPLTEALHNSMLPTATTPATLSKTSALGLALGNLAGLLILVFVLVYLALPGQVDWAFVPSAPVFGLDRATYEPERAVALFCAAWFALLALPLFLLSRDTPEGERWGAAFAAGARRVAGTLRALRGLGPLGRFLVARMFYADAKTAILVLGGVYVAGVMGWGLLEMTLYGIILSLLAVFGGFLAGWLDAAFGAKRAVQIQIAGCAFGLLGSVSTDRDTILFGLDVGAAPVWDSPVFASLPELTILFFVSFIAIFVTAAYASSRVLMTQLSPPERAGELFGLYALAGTATAWLGPMLVGFVTEATRSQQIGFGSLLALLAAGFVVLWGVKAPARTA